MADATRDRLLVGVLHAAREYLTVIEETGWDVHRPYRPEETLRTRRALADAVAHCAALAEEAE